jgi:putative phosphoribosyl transferase
LRSGGVALAAALERFRGAENTVVLAIVRGGVPAAVEVAGALGLPLDLLLLRALLPRTAGEPVRAARVAGNLVLDDELTSLAPDSIEQTFVDDALVSFAERDALCRGSRPPLAVAGKTVLLIDNGLRTGGTMISAIRALRTLAPARVIAAAPVAQASSLELAKMLADEVVCLLTPEPFGNVAMGYVRFEVPDEARIRTLLDAAG